MSLLGLFRWSHQKAINEVDNDIAQSQQKHRRLLARREDLDRRQHSIEFEMMNQMSYRAYRKMMRKST